MGLSEQTDVYAVLEDDGTEVDEEEYFQLLPDKALLMVLTGDQIWTPNFSLQGYKIYVFPIRNIAFQKLYFRF